MVREGPLWDAIDRSQLVIELDCDGTVRWANDRFLAATGYVLSDIVGRHHAMFCAVEESAEASEGLFWSDLAAGGHRGGQFRRVAADGAEIWLQATYTPIVDAYGTPQTIIKLATDVTDEVAMASEVSMRLATTLRARVEEEQDRARQEQLLERLREAVAAIATLAEQTKRLSLAAAIEAGRAGPAGRAFATFAAEIRQAAIDTRAATDEARGLIGG